MRILINRKPIEGPWGGGNLFVRAFCESMSIMGHEIVHDFDDVPIDIIFIQDPRPSRDDVNMEQIIAYRNRCPDVKIVHRVNECDARKGTSGVDEYLRSVSKLTDLTLFVSDWMRKYHEDRGWYSPRHQVLINGVDVEHFYPAIDRQRSEQISIITHHWSDNPMKGADVYEFLDQLVERDGRFTFTYVGRTKQKFANSRVISPLFGNELADELRRHDVYVTGTRFDPGPNHVLESLATGLPTFAYVEGGGACEFVGDKFIFSTPKELVSKLNSIFIEGIDGYRKSIYVPKGWHDVMFILENTLRNLTRPGDE